MDNRPGMTFDVVIIGGGIAGSSTAIQLSMRGYRVLLLEKQHYPAHKLCGEFLSVEGLAMFDRLGVRRAVLQAGARPINRTRITTPDGASFESALPGTALGLSRYTLDRLLFDHARKKGATARDGVTVRSVEGSLDDGFAVETTDGCFSARMVVGAYGKRSRLDRTLDRPFLHGRSPFVAFKAHYAGIDLPGVIELHAFPGGYCGLSPIEGRRVNACWIARAHALKAVGGTPDAMIEQLFVRNDALAHRFQALERVSERFIAVSQITFVAKGAFADDVLMVGDTAGMIAPMCGDGMAMALRGAELAVPFIASFLEAERSAGALRAAYADAWQREFGLRMRLGRWMHHGYCRPAVARMGVAVCRLVPGVGRWLIRKTRGAGQPSASFG